MLKKLFLGWAIALCFATSANAATWIYTGTINDCNEPLCELVPLVIGDVVSGQITLDVGANEAFTIPDNFTDFAFVVGQFPLDPANVDFSGSSGTTDANGDFATGVLNGAVTGGQLTGLGAAFVVDLITGDITLTVANGAVFVTSVAGSFTLQAVPVPAAVWLMGSGLLALAGLFRRKVA